VVGVLALAGTYALRHKHLVVASLWLLATLGPGLLLIASVWQPLFILRQFLWASVPFSVLLGAGLVVPSSVPARVALLATAVIAGGWGLTREAYAPFEKPRWRDAIRFLETRARRGEKVIVANYSVKRILAYHFSRKTAPLERFPFERSRKTSPLSALGSKHAIWVVARGSGGRLHQLNATLIEHGWKQSRVVRYGIEVFAWKYVRAGGETKPDRKRSRTL
jgi:hypothetical protein